MKLQLRNILLLILMLAAAGLAVAMRPSQMLADQTVKFDLETMIPRTFGDWREEKQSALQVVDPEGKEMLDSIYSQMLARTYINSKGYRIMLSLAYGGIQSREQQVHRPEVCYAAQGFLVSNEQKVSLQINGISIPSMRLEAVHGERREPITYWVRLGDSIVRGNVEQGLARMYYGLRGQIADALLFRVSSIDGDTTGAYVQQEEFINDLIKEIQVDDRSAVIGRLKD